MNFLFDRGKKGLRMDMRYIENEERVKDLYICVAFLRPVRH